MSFFDAHPGLSAMLAVLLCALVIGWLVLKKLEMNRAQSAVMLRRLDKKLSVSEGRMSGHVRGMYTAMEGAANSLKQVSARFPMMLTMETLVAMRLCSCVIRSPS